MKRDSFEIQNPIQKAENEIKIVTRESSQIFRKLFVEFSAAKFFDNEFYQKNSYSNDSPIALTAKCD